MPILIIAGHPFAGKTTFARTFTARPVVDVDEVYNRADRDQLRALRRAGDWAGFNKVTDPILREWASAAQPGTILLTHGRHAFEVLGPKLSTFVGTVLVPQSELLARITAYVGDEKASGKPLSDRVQRAFMAGYNRKQLEDAAKRDGTPTFPSFEAAVEHLKV